MTTYKTRPILFSSAMVRAILEDRKTQTRRVIKPQFSTVWGGGNSVRNGDKDYVSIHVNISMPDGSWKWIRCPYGKPGDRLWVKETWSASPLHVVTKERDGLIYKADNQLPYDHWRPSIFMPRWASRIELEIIKIHAERLQDITNTDALAEGVRESHFHQRVDWMDLDRYHALWESINKKNGHGWDTNPFVWVIEFKKI